MKTFTFTHSIENTWTEEDICDHLGLDMEENAEDIAEIDFEEEARKLWIDWLNDNQADCARDIDDAECVIGEE